MTSVTGLSPQAEQQYQERLLLRLARVYEPRYAKEIKSTMRKLARFPKNIGMQANIIYEHGLRLNKILTAEYSAAFELFGNRLLDSMLKSARGFETKRDIVPTDQFDREQILWIAQNGAEKVTQISRTTQKQAITIINDTLADAVAEGLSERQTASLLRAAMAEVSGVLAASRSQTISRTEAHNASQASQDIAARATELPMRKEWVASGGERTRETHSDANGQIVSMNDPFTVGADLLMYPGDTSGSPEETINCRCVVAYIPS